MKKIIATFIFTLLLAMGFTTYSANITELPENNNYNCLEIYQGSFLLFSNCGDGGMLGANVTDIATSTTLKSYPAIQNANMLALNTDKLDSYDVVGGTGIGWASTTYTITFDCSEVEGTGINCVGEAITLDTVAIALGGTATTTAPTNGQMLIGNASGGYDYVASSTLGTASDLSSYLTIADYDATTTHSLMSTLPVLVTIGTIGTGVWQGTAIDFSSYTNATASNGITISSDDIQPDTGYEMPLVASTTKRDQLVDNGDCGWNFSLFATSSRYSKTATGTIKLAGMSLAGTVQQMWCQGTAGTSTITAFGETLICGNGVNTDDDGTITTPTVTATTEYSLQYLNNYVGIPTETTVGIRCTWN